MGTQEVAASTGQPSLITTEQVGSHRGLLTVGEHHHAGLCSCSLPFSLYSINQFLLKYFDPSFVYPKTILWEPSKCRAL